MIARPKLKQRPDSGRPALIGLSPQSKAVSQRRRSIEILNAAARVFAERGYHGAATQDIADVLGIKQASLYYYFPSKEIALELVCMKGVEGFIEGAAEVAKGSHSTTKKVEQLVLEHLRPLVDRSDFVKCFLRERQYLPTASRKKVGALTRAYEKIIEQVIAEGVKSKEFSNKTDPRMTTLALIGLCKSVADWFGKENYELDQISRHISDLILHGISA